MTEPIVGQATSNRRWWVLAVVASAQFLNGTAVFVASVAIPTIVAELQASDIEGQAAIAIYLVSYGALIVIGGRLGDIYGIKTIFLAGLVGFILSSVWCGLSRSGLELILARLAQGATAALMVPQVLATLHLLFPDEGRSRAFAVYGIALGLGGAAGFAIGGILVTWNIAGLGWRSAFLVNVPIGLVIFGAALVLMTSPPRQPDKKLDGLGGCLLLVGLLCLIGPLLFGREFDWSLSVWATMALGVALVGLFVKFERWMAARGGLPLVDLALLADRPFLFGLSAAFFFFCANVSFYLVMSLFMQDTLRFSPLESGLALVPLTFAFIVASRHSDVRARLRGPLVLLEGCALQVVGLAALAVLVAASNAPSFMAVTLVLVIFGYGQGLVMAPLSSVVLSTVRPESAGSGSGLYGTVTQIANAVGVATIGAAYFSVRSAYSAPAAFYVALTLLALIIAICGGLLKQRTAIRGLPVR